MAYPYQARKGNRNIKLDMLSHTLTDKAWELIHGRMNEFHSLCVSCCVSPSEALGGPSADEMPDEHDSSYARTAT